MRNLAMGCAVAALIALSAKSDARPPASVASDAPITREAQCRIGIASWYGEECQGNLTANGEVYDINALTAAHRKLPFGTKIKVTNLRNSRSLVLTVNDRGPNIQGRFLDVSMAAAKRLGFLAAGLAYVHLEVVKYPERYLPSEAPPMSHEVALN